MSGIPGKVVFEQFLGELPDNQNSFAEPKMKIPVNRDQVPAVHEIEAHGSIPVSALFK